MTESSIAPAHRESIESVIGELLARPLLSAEARRALSDPWHRRAVEEMLCTGKTFGEATGGRGVIIQTRDEAEFREHLRSTDNDLAAQLRVVREGLEDYFSKGEFPAPYYWYRVAVILRKAKEYDLEARFCEAFGRHFAGGNGARYAEIVARASKARQLAAKKAGKRPTAG